MDVRFFDASVKTIFEAVNPEKLIVPEEDKPVAPDTAPDDESTKLGVLIKLV